MLCCPSSLPFPITPVLHAQPPGALPTAASTSVPASPSLSFSSLPLPQPPSTGQCAALWLPPAPLSGRGAERCCPASAGQVTLPPGHLPLSPWGSTWLYVPMLRRAAGHQGRVPSVCPDESSGSPAAHVERWAGTGGQDAPLLLFLPPLPTDSPCWA